MPRLINETLFITFQDSQYTAKICYWNDKPNQFSVDALKDENGIDVWEDFNTEEQSCINQLIADKIVE